MFLSTQDSVEFHYLLLSDCLRTDTADTATDARLQLFKLHGDLPQKVNLLSIMCAISTVHSPPPYLHLATSLDVMFV